MLSSAKNTPDFNNSISTDALRHNLYLQSPKERDGSKGDLFNRRESHKHS